MNSDQIPDAYAEAIKHLQRSNDMIMRDGISAKERVNNLGLNNERLLQFYQQKTEERKKIKGLIKYSIVNTKKKERTIL